MRVPARLRQLAAVKSGAGLRSVLRGRGQRPAPAARHAGRSVWLSMQRPPRPGQDVQPDVSERDP